MLSLFKSDPATVVARTVAIWPEGDAPPTFIGNPKKDGKADKWLALVQKQCEAHKVPQALWPGVARHFMSVEARERVEEVEKIMRCVCGDKWKWEWQGFTQAVSKIGWNIDAKKTQAVKARRGPSGWWLVGRVDDQTSKERQEAKDKKEKEAKDKKEAKAAETAKDKAKEKGKDAAKEKDKPKHAREPSKSADKGKEKAKVPSKSADGKSAKPPPPKLTRSATAPAAPTGSGSAFSRVGTSIISPFQRASTSPSATETAPTPAVVPTTPAFPLVPITPGVPIDPATIIAQVPVWLLGVTDILTTLTTQYSTTMSVLSAVLITVGSLPALHVVGAGAAVHMLGTAAVGLGLALQEKAEEVKEAQQQEPDKVEKGKLRRLFSASSAT